jgi:hypothetical protein
MANDLESQLGLNEEELLATQEYVRQEPVQDEHEVSLASYEQSQVFDLALSVHHHWLSICFLQYL